MESFIAKLLQDFEEGKMDRRQLIKSLALAATAAAAAATRASRSRPSTSTTSLTR
jgi:putative N-acetylmannosamine-6-phosphate epimerase